jgi:hypothetical protein
VPKCVFAHRAGNDVDVRHAAASFALVELSLLQYNQFHDGQSQLLHSLDVLDILIPASSAWGLDVPFCICLTGRVEFLESVSADPLGRYFPDSLSESDACRFVERLVMARIHRHKREHCLVLFVDGSDGKVGGSHGFVSALYNWLRNGIIRTGLEAAGLV